MAIVILFKTSPMRNFLLLLLTITLCICMPKNASAQNISFQHLSTENGLSQVSVNSIYIDEAGRIWIATRDGLNCYNGQYTQTFRLEKDNPHSLFSNTVLRITGDHNGHIYLLCTDGVAELTLSTMQFKTLIHGKVDCMNFTDRLYILCKNEIFTYNASTGNFDSFYRISCMSCLSTELFIDSNKTFWIGTESDGVYTLSKDKELKHRIKKVQVTRMYEDSSRNIWIGTWEDGIYKIDKNDEMTNIRKEADNPNSLSSNFARCFCEDNQGCIWIGTMNGLNKYDPHTNRFTLYKPDIQSPASLSHSSVWCIEKDSQGTLWLGTYFGGVNYFNPEYEIYTIYRRKKHELSFPVVGNMLEDKDGRLWICTEGGGINVLDRKTGKFTRYTHTSSPNSISHNNVKAIYYDEAKDIMWIGTHLGGLNRLDIRTERFTCYKREIGNPETLPSDIIRDIVPYKDSLIVATQNGVCMFSTQTGKCTQLFKDDKLGSLIKMVADLEFDQQGRLWISVNGDGVFCYDFSTGKLSQLKHSDEDANTICNNNINSIFKDNRGMLWFASAGSGLDCYDPTQHKFTNYDTKNSQLISDCIYKVCETKDNELLIISNTGFSRFNYQTKKVKNYSSENGLPIAAINENGLYITKDQTVFLGGVDGMISFSLNKMKIAPQPYNIFWTKLVVNGNEIKVGDESGILPKTLNEMGSIKLNASQNMFSLYFSSSNYLLENKERMEYYLDGFSKKWTDTQGQPAITYTNLSPGTYTLRLRSVKPETLSHEIAIKIVILPPFYRTAWAYLLYLLAIAGSVYYLMRTYKMRVKLRESLRYEQKHLQDIENLNQSKLRFFTSISHEFRTPLTLIIGQLENILKQPQTTPALFSKILTAYKSSMQLKGLISELLDFRKQEQGMMKIKVQQYNIIQFLNETYLLFLAYAQSKKIKIEFNRQQEDIEVWFDATQMQKVLNNLLSNAIKHCAKEGCIVLSAYQEGGMACFSVEDDGIGIPAAEIGKIFNRFYQASNESEVNAGTGIGLALTKGIVELHHGTIEVESTEGKGTKFIVKLPMGTTAYSTEEIATVSAEKQQEQNIITPIDTKEEIAEEIPANELNEPVSKDGQRPSILIVEDNESIRNMLTELFSPIYDTFTAEDGVKALEVINEHMPQIVLSDVLMPRMSGIELTKQLKSNIDTCHIPVVLLTARTEIEQNLEGLRIGADDYITKPFNSRILISRCNNLVNSRIMLQEYFSKQPAAQTPVLATNPLDKQFLDEVIDIFEKHLEDTDFTIDKLAQEMFISRTRVYSKIKAITGQTPNDFFITLRLKKAAHMLKSNPELNIIAISEQTGFSSSRYFSKLFKKAYDVTPMEYRKGKADTTTDEEE